MDKNKANELIEGCKSAYIDGNIASNILYRPQFVSNNYKEGKKVISYIEDELRVCDKFQISVAFITMGGITPLLQILKELEEKNIPGEILTTNYLNFSEPRALSKLNELSNITIKMYDVETAKEGFHTKGYIFKKDEIYRIIVGSSNITSSALTINREWNTKILSTEQGELAKDILLEFNELWNSKYSLNYNEFYETYKEKYKLIKHQRDIAKKDSITSIEKYKLKPNSMQVKFIANLRKLIQAGENRAILISATGTGKTYASAFAMRELGFKKVLFLVHRSQLARQSLKSYKNVFSDNISMGLVGSGYKEYDKDYIFATVQTLNKEDYLKKYAPDNFDCIILDEAHHSSADTYQKIMSYFKPKLWLGMTATPDKRDDNIAGKNIYEIFNHNIAYEIRLQQAMKEDLLCPFHYFGITDISMLDDKKISSKKMDITDFNQLVSDERVSHIIKQANYYGYSGERVKGLVFCSRIDETEKLSKKFNALGYRTIALNGNSSEEERTKAFERLAMNEEDITDELKPLDYIFSVEILNEGVDIVEVNQIIMLRPTQSPIVFTQQLGRGLRKVEGKEYTVILDFIGNYKNNFMIPIALSGDKTYNADTIKKYVISGNNTIPGASTIHFDEISKQKIFSSIDKIKGMKSIIRESYSTLKNRIGRVPYLIDFYENGEIDPLIIIKEYKSYQNFLEDIEKDLYIGKITDGEKLVLEYLSKTVLSGIRPYELEILKQLLNSDNLNKEKLRNNISEKYGYYIDDGCIENAIKVLQGHFVINENEYAKFKNIDIVLYDENKTIKRMIDFANRLKHLEFHKQIKDIINVGLLRYKDKYLECNQAKNTFVLYEKYSRRDVSFIMNCEKDLSSIMYGMKKIGNDVFIFVTYNKELNYSDEKLYADGKPNYADEFEDNMIFMWDSQLGKGVNSKYIEDVVSAKRKHLFVKKSDIETSFYYMGEFNILNIKPAQKKDNNGKLRDIAKLEMKMINPVREDILRYLKNK
jgi:superfamily II DNA or RNA helicase/HKD family nuclease